MNILLINPPCRLPVLLPLGLGYIASVAREKGHKVHLLDINGMGYDAEEVERQIRELDFDVVGIGGLSSTYRYVKWLANLIDTNRPGVPIIAGNMVSTAHPETLLENSKVDIAVIDEGELTFIELLKMLGSKGNLKDVKGICYKDGDGNIIKTPPQKRLTNLDVLPHPAWDLFPMETYVNNSTFSRTSFGLRQINVSTERGCPYDCKFCSHPFGRQVYTRSAESIIKEIKELKKKYRIQFINFTDDLFMLNEKRVIDFCSRMISEKLDIKWSTSGRVNLVNLALLEKMRKAGCIELTYGFESGSQAILDGIHKRVTVRQAEEAVRMTREAGIEVTGSFIFGLPQETRETIKETLSFIKRTQLPLYRFFYATPFPGTELYEIARRMRRLPADEDRYLESLGEMRTTFLVNLTDFSDEELVSIKNLAERSAKRNLTLRLKFDEFKEEWQRRYIVYWVNLKNYGPILTLKLMTKKILEKVKPLNLFSKESYNS